MTAGSIYSGSRQASESPGIALWTPLGVSQLSVINTTVLWANVYYARILWLKASPELFVGGWELMVSRETTIAMILCKSVKAAFVTL